MVLEPHPLCKYSITCHTNDLAVFHCLHALCDYAEPSIRSDTPKSQENQWRNSGNRVTLWFAHASCRDKFEAAAQRLLPGDLWSVVEKKA